MNLNTDRIFAYLKVALPESASVDIELSGENDLLMMPFVGDLIVSLAYDLGDRFELLQRRHLTELAMDQRELFELGLGNLESLVSSGQVRMHKQGAGYAIIAGGNFEASLLLVDSVWDWVCGQVGTSRLLARAPARDLLMVVPADDSEGIAELEAFRSRVTNAGLDHALSGDLLLWEGKEWRVVPGEGSPRISKTF